MSNFDRDSDSQTFWNEEGGSKWVENIDFVESIMVPMSERLLEQIDARSGEHVLDVGCGGGITSMKLAGQVGAAGRVLGVDVSLPILSVAINRAEGIDNLDFHHADAATADLGEDRFDVITSRFGVMFFDDPVLAFNNLRRTVKPEGRLVFLCWRTMEENPWMAEPAKAAFGVIPPPADAEKPDPTDPGPFSLGDEDHLRNILGSAGFSNIELDAMDMGMPMGDLDDSVSFLLKMGPAAEVIKDASVEQQQEVRVAVREVLERYSTTEGIVAPTATWLVSASK